MPNFQVSDKVVFRETLIGTVVAADECLSSILVSFGDTVPVQDIRRRDLQPLPEGYKSQFPAEPPC